MDNLQNLKNDLKKLIEFMKNIDNDFLLYDLEKTKQKYEEQIYDIEQKNNIIKNDNEEENKKNRNLLYAISAKNRIKKEKHQKSKIQRELKKRAKKKKKKEFNNMSKKKGIKTKQMKKY